ncbi:MAG: rhomboid family intrarane serine protease [Thermoleophilia bacterium]|nr:rhomboid family intrarane serine protease [Thermoleophilia bacterium]
MRARATENGPADGWRGARIGAVNRDRVRRAAARIPAEVDIGEPGTPVVTAVFLVATVAVTLWEFSKYGTSPDAVDLARAGGSSLGAIATGSWWKLLTANLLHGNVMHVVLNAAFLVIVGRLVEHLAGRTVVLATVLWSAVLTSVVSILVSGTTVAIGASGVLFGLMGCAVALDPRGRTAVGVTVRPLLILNAIYTFIAPGVSIGGHLGGFVAGVLVGAVCWRRRRSEETPAGSPRRAVAAALVVAAIPVVAVLALGPRVLPDEARSARGRIVAPLLTHHLDGAQFTGGLTLRDLSCEPTDDPAAYACRFDRDGAPVDGRITIDPTDDQPRVQASGPASNGPA